MGVWITEGPETVIVLLASGIPEGELDVLAVNFDVCDVVLEHCWDVDLVTVDESRVGCGVEREAQTHFWEGSFGEHNQQAGLDGENGG